MNKFVALTAGLSLFALAACDSGDKKEDQKAVETPAAEAPAAETPSAVETAVEKAAEVVKALSLDTSSLDAFKESLSNMKASLSEDDKARLATALGKLAADAAGNSEGGGALSMAKDMASGKSMEETLYEKMGDALNGLTFEDLLAKAG